MIIYVDGSCLNNGAAKAKGGFGILILDDKENILERYYSPSNGYTTNNRQELLAIFYALIKYGKNEEIVTVYSDSAYAINTYTDWMFRWQENGWKRSKNKEIENLDIIQSYYRAIRKGYRIDLRKCAGHENKWNILVDKIAKGLDNQAKEVSINEQIIY